MATVTLCPPSPQHVSFDECQFDRKLTKRLPFAYADRLSFGHRVKSRRHTPVPEFANSNTGLQEALVKYLEARFRITPSGDIKERLERCREAAKESAEPTKVLLKRAIERYQALCEKRWHDLPPSLYQKAFLNRLRGESDEKLIETHGRQVSVWDSEYFNILRAPELAMSIAYLSLRLGYDSPSVAESLSMRAPAVRQILSRFIQRAVRKTDTLKGRRKKKESNAKPR